jgi:uncharacterized protein YjeT (DUF2065 family)
VIELRDLATGIGIALAFEGAVWGAAPGAMRRAMQQLENAPDGALRMAALTALGVGVAIVWAARSGLHGG